MRFNALYLCDFDGKYSCFKEPHKGFESLTRGRNVPN
jgi:hypothetical protein